MNCANHGQGRTGTRCPCSLPCPECYAKPGAPCVRPSEHRAAGLHQRRALAAEFVDSLNGVQYHAREYTALGLRVPPFALPDTTQGVLL